MRDHAGMEPSVRSSVEGGVALITLHRPEVLNALDTAMIEELILALRAAGDDAAVRALVLTGAGRGFCAGGDVRAIAGAGGHDRTELAGIVRRLGTASELLFSLPKPTIAAGNGPCAGAGLSLACAADLRVAARSALFTTAFARVGQSGDYGGIWHLTRLLGSARARELVLLSERVPAEVALDLGLVSAVLPDDELLPHALALARRFAAFAPLTVAALKANLNDAAGDLGSYLDREATRFAQTTMTRDAREAAAAFVEKRTPRFEGR
jgi:2-(1,2-epoxy-1,2-dihydrophenyl)acetyl-CoA isomerase